MRSKSRGKFSDWLGVLLKFKRNDKISSIELNKHSPEKDLNSPNLLPHEDKKMESEFPLKPKI